MAVFCDAGLGDGEYDLHVLGLLQHLSFGRRDSRSGEKHSARNFSFDHRNRGAVSGDADEHFGCAAVAAGARLAVHRERIHREVVRRRRSEICDGDDFVDRVRIAVLFPAGIFARPVFGGARREFFQRVRAGASEEAIPACVAAIFGRPGVFVRAAVQVADRDRGGAGDATDHSIYWAGGGSCAAAAAVACGEIAI